MCVLHLSPVNSVTVFTYSQSIRIICIRRKSETLFKFIFRSYIIFIFNPFLFSFLHHLHEAFLFIIYITLYSPEIISYCIIFSICVSLFLSIQYKYNTFPDFSKSRTTKSISCFFSPLYILKHINS